MGLACGSHVPIPTITVGVTGRTRTPLQSPGTGV